MKNYKNLVLVGAMVTSAAHAGIEIGQYFSGDYVDRDGRTFLHKAAQHSCGEKFIVKLDLFDFSEKKMPAEMPKLEKQAKEMMFLHRLAPELAAIVAIGKMSEFIHTKDNNGDTALDLAKKCRDEVVLNGGVPHERNQLLIEVLEQFESARKDQEKNQGKNQELVSLMENAVN